MQAGHCRSLIIVKRRSSATTRLPCSPFRVLPQNSPVRTLNGSRRHEGPRPTSPERRHVVRKLVRAQNCQAHPHPKDGYIRHWTLELETAIVCLGGCSSFSCIGFGNSVF